MGEVMRIKKYISDTFRRHAQNVRDGLILKEESVKG